jgi:phosphatidylinositol alpha-mannosyltransferase
MRNGPSLNVGLVFDDSLDSNDGVAQYVKNLGSWLSQRGHKVSYLVGETKLEVWAGGKVYSLARNLKVHFNGNKLSMPVWSSAKLVGATLRANEYDVLHVMVPYSPLMAKKVIKKADSKTMIIGTFHILPSGFLSRFGSKLLWLWLRRSLTRFDKQLSASSAAASFARSSYKISSTISPNMVDLKKFRSIKTESRRTIDPQKIVFLGRLVKRKGVAELKKKKIDAELIIAGDGPDRSKLSELVQNLGLSRDVKFLGYIDERDKPALLASADVACFPSLYGECFGIVLIEAMAAGSGAVLGGDNPGYRSVLGDQPLMLIDPNNTGVFTQRLERLLTDKALISKLYKWQNDNVEQYDINVVGRQVEQIYYEAIAQRVKKVNNKANE